jgi:spermidine synthase
MRVRVAQRASVCLVALLVLFTALLCAGVAYAAGLGPVVYRKDTLYHRVSVSRLGSIVTLQFGRRDPDLRQSQVDLSNLRRHSLEYSMLAFAGLLYNGEPKRMLMVGLGGGVIAREMSHYYPDLEVDVVEIDPEIPFIAKRYFGFETSDRMKVNVADGRVFIRELRRDDPDRKYDLVILDAFNSDYIPFHLMTREFLQQVQAVLTDEGVVVANVFYSSRLFDAELLTFLDVFPWCQVYFGARSTNAMLIAPGSAKVAELTLAEAVRRAEALQKKREFAFDFPWVARRLRLDVRPAPRTRVLTDDRAPVNLLSTQKRD